MSSWQRSGLGFPPCAAVVPQAARVSLSFRPRGSPRPSRATPRWFDPHAPAAPRPYMPSRSHLEPVREGPERSRFTTQWNY